MSAAEQHEDLMDLARRALAHQQNHTTDMTEAVMSMPVDAYTDPGRYQAERTRIFKTLPLAMALTIELPEPGDFKTIYAMDTPLLLVRGDDGVARAFLNVCRHRGARLCESDAGNTRTFSCPYHAWVYDRQGELVSRYGSKTFGEVNQSELGLAPLACAEAAGIIWVTLGSAEPFDIDSWLGGMKDKLETLELDSWHLFDKRELVGPGWKVTMDGYLEIYHHNSVHGATVGQHTIGNLLVLDTFGPHQRLTLGRRTLGSLAEETEENWEPLQHIRLVHNCFPNLSISGILGDHCLVSQIFPGPTPDNTSTIQMVLSARKPETEEELSATENFSAMVLQAVQDEDYRLGLLIQEGITSGANHEFLYGKNEPAVQNYHNWIAHFMRQEADINWT
jgi:phenylpropionate dioxygenase-like ring-hydroxylating dioxygenase large terminal subunit